MRSLVTISVVTAGFSRQYDQLLVDSPEEAMAWVQRKLAELAESNPEQVVVAFHRPR